MQPPSGTARNKKDALKIAHQLEYPVLVRPSYVLGGRAMQIVYDDGMLQEFMEKAIEVSPEHPVLIDKFLEDAAEVDVDAICDGKTCVICGVMEHVEQAGIHSGDSAMVLPPYSLKEKVINEIKQATKKLALSLNVVGLLNIQFAVKDDNVYILEVNPRASRTVPFVSKVTGVPLAKLATKIMLGMSLKKLHFEKEIRLNYFAVKNQCFHSTDSLVSMLC
jgi:carbamoyl-phosphate synthase large subunit